VHFQARVEPESLKVDDKRLSWRIFQMTPSPDPKKGPTAGPPRPIGSGRNVSAEVGPGSYQVELSLAMGEKGNIVKKGNFRVDVSVSGRVVHNGQGLPETDFTLAEVQTQKKVAEGRSDREGAFFVELPPTGNYRLTPSKPGFSFNPPYAFVVRKPQPVKVDFQGAKARIEGIRLIPDETSDEEIEELCPDQIAFFKAAVESEARVRDLTVLLIPTAPGSAPINIGRATYSGDTSVPPTAVGSAPVKVEIPLDAGRGTKLTAYRLRVTAVDDKGNTFSAEAREPIKLDMAKCLDRKFAEAASLQEQGELEQAIKLYDRVEEYHNSLGDPSASSETMEKMFFNEGLAFLRMAMPLGSDDLKRHGHLAKALNDFNEVLKLHKRDADAFMFRGLALEMRQNPGAALESYNSAIGSDPKLADAYVLRGLAYMESGAKKNLSRAVDDFTEAITLNPAQTDLRALRKALLSLDISLQKEKDDSPVDTSAFAARKAEIIQSRLNQRKHIRK
jgi:tetratricopeptide (TPR) repeat protein